MFNPASNYSNLPFIVEGEIVEVHDYPADTTKKIRPMRYVCKVEMQNGSEILLPNCIESTIFGGIADYMQIRHKSSKDDLSAGQGDSGALGAVASAASSLGLGGGDGPYNFSNQDDKNNSRVGDRVYIAFINGHITRPVIVGSAQHPNQTDEFGGEVGGEIKPQAIFQYNGMRVTIDKDGQFTLMHKGLPKIKQSPGAGAKSAEGSGLVGAALGGDVQEPENDAVEFPPSEDERTLMEFLKTGIFRIRDSDGQMIEIDKNKKRIYISNNDLKSTEPIGGGGLAGALSGGLQLLTNSTDAEYVLLDKDKELVLINARSIAQIYSFDRRKDVTEGNHSHRIGGDSEWLIQGNESQIIGGGRDHKINEDDVLVVGGNKQIAVVGDVTESAVGKKTEAVGGDLTMSVSGKVAENYIGAWEVVSAGGITLNGSGGVLKLANGMVGLGGPAAELLDLMDQLLQQLDTLITQMQIETHTGNLGYPTSPPLNAAAYAAVQSAIAVIKTMLGLIKGGI